VPLHARSLLALSAVVLAACSGSKDGGTGVAVVTVEPQVAALCIGDSLTFTAHLLDASGDTVMGSPVRWSSSAPTLVSVDSVSGVAHALTFGTAQITAAVGSLRSASPGRLDVPSDVVAEAVPDTAILAPGDTFTVGARLRRLWARPWPSRVPVITPLDTAPASITAAGLVTAKAAGTASFTLSACGFTGRGAVQVYSPPDSLTGTGYLWASGHREMRLRFATAPKNYMLSGAKPAFEVFGSAAVRSAQFAYVDSLRLAGTGTFPVDSIRSSEVASAGCAPPRPFAVYGDNAPSSLLSMHGGTVVVSTYSTSPGFRAISGRMVARLSGFLEGLTTAPDTLRAIFTFSAPLRDTTGVCP
jgi:hypothetical protein